MERIPVLITTERRGVFFGYVPPDTVFGQSTLTLADARNCLYWSADVRGFLGLAATGPSSSCRIGPQVPSLTLFGVTAVARVTPEAAERWEAAPWKA